MSTSDSMGINPTNNSSDTIDEVKEEISQVSSASADAARDVAESRFEQGREATTEQLDTASEAMDEVAQKLEEKDSPFASYAAELSDQLSSFSNKLSTSSIDDLVGGARTLARDNPAAFMLGSMAIGLAASRFFKATGEQVYRQSNASGATSGNYYDERGDIRRHGYNPGGMSSLGNDAQSSRRSSTIADANDAVRSSANPSESQSSSHLQARQQARLRALRRAIPGPNDSTTTTYSHNEDAAGRSARTTREETENEY